jgi:hypothetical protein
MSAVWDGAGRYRRQASLERITAAATAVPMSVMSSTRLGLLSRAQPLKVIAERYLDQLEHHNHSQFEWRVQLATSLVALAVN